MNEFCIKHPIATVIIVFLLLTVIEDSVANICKTAITCEAIKMHPEQKVKFEDNKVKLEDRK